ncbi:hypothetical protein LUZ60_003564 [Juncus effusus]|nr:hypothetical protein LUZ60_003564 [Juncus effusus]
MQDRVDSWRSKLLSYGGRNTLIKANLGALPVYFMQAFKLPKWVIKQLNRVIRSFFWKGESSCLGGKCLVKWSRACLPKKHGGLGIADLASQNKALLLKWIWKLDNDKDGLWAQMVNLTQGISDSIMLGQLSHSSSSFFLNDLSSSILPIYNASTTLDDLSSRVMWRWNPNGIFSSKSAYAFIRNPGLTFRWSTRLWKIKCPPRVKLFAWLLLHNKALTAENLAKRRWPHNERCVMCNLYFEDRNHLFIGCSFARWYWRAALGHFRITANLEIPFDNLWLHHRTLLSKEEAKNWDILWVAGLWTIWLERNRRIFSSTSRSPDALLRWAAKEVASWADHC